MAIKLDPCKKCDKPPLVGTDFDKKPIVYTVACCGIEYISTKSMGDAFLQWQGNLGNQLKNREIIPNTST